MSLRTVVRVTLPIIALGASTFALMAFFPGRGKEHETGKIYLGSIAGSIEETGSIGSDEEYTYFAGVTAPVASIAIEEGDEVRFGEKLLEYDVEDFERNAEHAALTRVQSEDTSKGKIGKSDSYQAKYNKAVDDDNTYAVLYWWQREASDYISEDQYQENWNTEKRATELNTCIASKNQQIAEKSTKLLDGGLSDEDRQQLEKDISGLKEDIARAQVELAALPQLALTPEEYRLNNDVSNMMEDISRNWNETKTNKAKYEEGVLNSGEKAALLDQVEIAKEQESYARIDLEKARQGITSDFNGIVTSCHVKAGSVASKGDPLFTIVSRDDMKVTVMISKYDISSIAVGQRAEIDASGTRYIGKVSKIRQIAVTDSSDKSKVAVDVKIEGGRGLILGLEADVTIYTDEKADVLLMPYQAFYSDDDGEYCYIINDEGRIEKKYFTAGIVSGDAVEVIDGLTAGMSVITDAVTDEQIGEKAFEAVH
ncbi:MAG: HlyD family efflux transporter periplasmic adaptor subunit [Lachnospiraceae bacterium]|nr:HlyD family efflux transporter periplasmic adaptor subunit [Lachnospiraceae bacterium]